VPWRFLRALSCPARIIAAVSPLIPLIPVAAGFVALVAGILVLRTYGPNYRVGRLLASTPEVSVAEAREMAAGPARYIRVAGRIDAEDEFEDDAHRPLVFRRTRLQVSREDGWATFEDSRERVRFEIRDGLDGIVVDDSALDAGLVVVPRESVGTAADLPDRVPPGTPVETPVRLRIEQVSSIEHAIVLGVPVATGSGVQLTSGLGRPLVLSTLEIPEAMRVLGGGRAKPAAVLVLLAIGLGLVALALLWAAIAALR